MTTEIESIDKNVYNFNLPIYYINKKNKVDDNIKEDLELIESKDISGECLYDYVFETDNILGKEIIPLWSEYYCYDKEFLTNSQELITTYKPTNINFDQINKTKTIWDTVHNDKAFLDRYQYINMPYLNRYNTSVMVLHIYSIYNLSSPALSLIMPIFFLIIPFFVLKMQGINITISGYKKILWGMIKNISIIKLFTEFDKHRWDKKISLLFSSLFYCFQIYQNVCSCLKFYFNINKITDYIKNIKDYIGYSCKKIDEFLNVSSNLVTYSPFNSELKSKKDSLIKYYNKFNKLKTYKYTVSKINQIGYLMKYFYDIKFNTEFVSSMNYIFGFHGYIDNLCSLENKITKKELNFCTFTDKNTSFTKSYYGPLSKTNVIKNSYHLKKHHIITGPNAAGKTTILKSTLFNILLSQQIGGGYYSKAKINMYHYLHCYLNIPDTSGRDSLFQAEARRCKEILDKIENSKTKRHFCIFDELYSGTNPYDATNSAHQFLSYLTKYNTINFILTTHYVDLCDRLKNNKKIKNSNMKIIKTKDDIKFTYKLTNGICRVKGGHKILKDLGYPDEIIDNTFNS